MKVLIFYASYGGGHLNAAKSIDECIKNNLIYEEKNYHNVVFVGYDEDKNARYAFCRGTNAAAHSPCFHGLSAPCRILSTGMSKEHKASIRFS